MYFLYVHITPNNKLYIGITNNIEGRWATKGLQYKGCSYFYKAIKKYGWDNIRHIILMQGLSKQVACECEKYLITKYQTTNPKYGYNLTNGGEGITGFVHSQLTKDKIGKANKISNKGNIVSEETKLKISLAMKGKKRGPVSEVTKQKISASKKGKKHGPMPESVKVAIGNANRGHKMSEEQKHKLSLAHKGKTFTAEHKDKIRQSNMGKHYKK